MKLVFLDTETGGLDPNVHPLIEIGWWVDGDPSGPRSVVLPHNPAMVDAKAAEVNHYYERGLDQRKYWNDHDPEVYDALVSDLEDSILVGANIAFDEGFLNVAGFSGWHYRKLDLESFAVPVLGFREDKRHPGHFVVPGLKDITDWLRRIGYPVPEPDHTATGDVRTTEAVYRALNHEYELRGI